MRLLTSVVVVVAAAAAAAVAVIIQPFRFRVLLLDQLRI